MRAIEELEGVIAWLKQVDSVVKDYEKTLEWKRDWKFVAKLRDHLKSLRTLHGILDGVACAGAMKEALGDMLMAIAGGIAEKLDSSLTDHRKGGG